MFQRSGAGLRRAVVMAASVAGFGMMAAMAGGAMAADDKGSGHEEYLNAAPNCSVNQDWSYFRKCGDTEHQPRAETKQRSREIERPIDNEPVGAAAAPSRD
jgi:hypothetical protein